MGAQALPQGVYLTGVATPHQKLSMHFIKIIKFYTNILSNLLFVDILAFMSHSFACNMHLRGEVNGVMVEC